MTKSTNIDVQWNGRQLALIRGLSEDERLRLREQEGGADLVVEHEAERDRALALLATTRELEPNDLPPHAPGFELAEERVFELADDVFVIVSRDDIDGEVGSHASVSAPGRLPTVPEVMAAAMLMPDEAQASGMALIEPGVISPELRPVFHIHEVKTSSAA